MIRIKFDRDSVCIGDDIYSHTESFDVDETMSVDSFINFLYSMPYVIASISGGEATWILQLRKDIHFYIDIAVFAQQWSSVKYISHYTTIGEITKYYGSMEFYAKYLRQIDPDVVYNNLKELRF